MACHCPRSAYTTIAGSGSRVQLTSDRLASRPDGSNDGLTPHGKYVPNRAAESAANASFPQVRLLGYVVQITGLIICRSRGACARVP